MFFFSPNVECGTNKNDTERFRGESKYVISCWAHDTVAFRGLSFRCSVGVRWVFRAPHGSQAAAPLWLCLSMLTCISDSHENLSSHDSWYSNTMPSGATFLRTCWEITINPVASGTVRISIFFRFLSNFFSIFPVFVFTKIFKNTRYTYQVRGG